MEKNLEKINKKLDQQMLKNKELRQEIDKLRKEKIIFEGVYLRLQKNL